jgi:hypothetical protein
MTKKTKTGFNHLQQRRTPPAYHFMNKMITQRFTLHLLIKPLSPSLEIVILLLHLRNQLMLRTQISLLQPTTLKLLSLFVSNASTRTIRTYKSNKIGRPASRLKLVGSTGGKTFMTFTSTNLPKLKWPLTSSMTSSQQLTSLTRYQSTTSTVGTWTTKVCGKRSKIEDTSMRRTNVKKSIGKCTLRGTTMWFTRLTASSMRTTLFNRRMTPGRWLPLSSRMNWVGIFQKLTTQRETLGLYNMCLRNKPPASGATHPRRI